MRIYIYVPIYIYIHMFMYASGGETLQRKTPKRIVSAIPQRRRLPRSRRTVSRLTVSRLRVSLIISSNRLVY